MKQIIYDIEVYPNHTCLSFTEDGETIKTIDGIRNIRKVKLDKYIWVGFNNRKYDHVILESIQDNATQGDVYRLSRKLVSSEGSDPSWAENIIDTYEICPKQHKCSLKEFGHRLKYPTLQNLPYKFDVELSDDEWELVKQYCHHDVRITYLLWQKLKYEQETREQLKQIYGIKLIGGAPALAQKCILADMPENSRVKESDEFHLKNMNNFILSNKYSSLLDSFLTHDYTNGIPEEMDKKYYDYGLEIIFGVGGIHGMKAPGIYHNVYDYDISSFYPAIILNCELGSEEFREVFQEIFDKRIYYKKKKDKKADALKLILNSLSGKFRQHKFANPRIFAPEVALNLCILGQFYMVDLVEKLKPGIVLAVNTDGIIVSEEIDESIIKEFEQRTNFLIEKNEIETLVLQNVNSYYAKYQNGSEKRKKEFLDLSWKNSCKGSIIQRSVLDFIFDKHPIEETIKQSKDPFEFLFFTKVKAYEDKYLFLGKTKLEDPKIRWYVSNQGEVLTRVSPKMKSKVLKNEFVSLAMNIEDFDFNNLNYDFYIRKAYELLTSLGVNNV